jgi:hypothetical protein
MVDSGEGPVSGGGVEAGIGGRVPDALEIFLFDEAIVVKTGFSLVPEIISPDGDVLF